MKMMHLIAHCRAFASASFIDYYKIMQLRCVDLGLLIAHATISLLMQTASVIRVCKHVYVQGGGPNLMIAHCFATVCICTLTQSGAMAVCVIKNLEPAQSYSSVMTLSVVKGSTHCTTTRFYLYQGFMFTIFILGYPKTKLVGDN